MPCDPADRGSGQADLAVLERWADPRALLAAGQARLTALIAKASHGHQGAARAEQWRAAAAAAVELYGDHPAIAFADLAAEVATEVRLLRAAQAELAAHAAEREDAYRWTDPGQLGAHACPGWPRSAARRWPRHRPGRPGSPPARTSSPTPGWPRAPRRPAKPTARANPCPRPEPAAAHHPDPRRRHTPANRTRSWPRSTTRRWSNAAPSTSRPAAWSPRTWPNGLGRACTAACPTSSATPTAPRSPRPGQSGSSPSSGPCPAEVRARRRSRKSHAGPRPAERGRPLSKSTRDMTGQTHRGRRQTRRPSPPPDPCPRRATTRSTRRTATAPGRAARAPRAGHRPARYPCPGPAEARGSRAAAGRRAGMRSTLDAGGAGPYNARPPRGHPP